MLEKGETKFICLEDMISFLHSLQPLFLDNGSAPVAAHPGNNTGVSPLCETSTQLTEAGTPPAEEDEPAVDKEKLREIRAQAATPKMVWSEEIADRLKKGVFGQDEVIDALARKIVINRMRQDKKLLTIGLLGPTGTGKSETGKSLAAVLTEVYGTPFE